MIALVFKFKETNIFLLFSVFKFSINIFCKFEDDLLEIKIMSSFNSFDLKKNKNIFNKTISMMRRKTPVPEIILDKVKSNNSLVF